MLNCCGLYRGPRVRRKDKPTAGNRKLCSGDVLSTENRPWSCSSPHCHMCCSFFVTSKTPKDQKRTDIEPKERCNCRSCCILTQVVFVTQILSNKCNKILSPARIIIEGALSVLIPTLRCIFSLQKCAFLCKEGLKNVHNTNRCRRINVWHIEANQHRFSLTVQLLCENNISWCKHSKDIAKENGKF